MRFPCKIKSMSYSTNHFQLCKVFFDETTLPYNGKEYFMWGALFLPIDCDLSLKLGELRKKLGFLHTTHFSDGKNFPSKEKQFIEKALEAFIDSTAVFRAIVASGIEWQNIKNKISQANLAGQLLSYPWMPYEKDIYGKLSRSRIIFDRISMNPLQEKIFTQRVNKMITRPNELPDAKSYPIKDAAIVFADKTIFDELQLVDIINGIIRISYLLMSNKNGISSEKLGLHKDFLSKFPNLGSFIKTSRLQTNGKLNVWHIIPR